MTEENLPHAFIPPDAERLEREIKDAIAKYPNANMTFIVGQVMKATNSTANPKTVESMFNAITSMPGMTPTQNPQPKMAPAA